MVHVAHDVPCLAVILDVTPPGKRFEADAQAASSSSIAQLAEIVDDAGALAE